MWRLGDIQFIRVRRVEGWGGGDNQIIGPLIGETT